MELTKKDIKITKGVAILFMLFLHLFCRKDINELYTTFINIKEVPLVYYLALFGDACVPIYCFVSGYGLFTSNRNGNNQNRNNLKRISKLLLNYWIVLIIFVMIGFLFGKAAIFPGSLVKFMLNFFVLSSSYNGAWWFLQTYIILVILSPLLFKLVKQSNSLSLLLASNIIYLLSYMQRIKHIIHFGDNFILVTTVNAVVLVGTSQLPFIIGAIFSKEKTYSKFYIRFDSFKFKNTLCVVGILILVIIHAIYESMFIAPFTGISFLVLFNLMNKNVLIQRALNYIGTHSTNLWLTHMFFYMSIFPRLTFAPRYPILIFIWLIIMCLISSYLINYIYNQAIKFITTKASSNITIVTEK